MKQPRLLKKVYQQVQEHTNYNLLPRDIKESLESCFEEQEEIIANGNKFHDYFVNQLKELSNSEKTYYNKMLRDTWKYLYLEEDTLSQYEITVIETNPYEKYIKLI